jgi:hypothetical protein
VNYATFGDRVRAARAAVLALWHEHETPPAPRWQDRRVYRRVPRQPDACADPATALSDAREAFGGQTRISTTDMFAALAAADPGRYGSWDHNDLGDFMSRQGIRHHRLNIKTAGRRYKPQRYWLEDVTAALEDLTAPGALAGQAA